MTPQEMTDLMNDLEKLKKIEDAYILRNSVEWIEEQLKKMAIPYFIKEDK